ncbi:MAG TPA: TAXI family TRAP transporter solute-binding subunit [Candidatus Saccharimonadales bacterium]|nr:TAXI family TRAP transporter solute-binding subunit [Candidatus Saccharimonadales bacterium]
MKQDPTDSEVTSDVRDTFGLGRGAALLAMLFIGIVVVAAGIFFFKSAPPTHITMTSGPEGSTFRTNAEKYRIILEKSKVKLTILPSRGSLENLQRLDDLNFKVDVGFVQGGITNGMHTERLVSLGSIAYQPLMVFYRGTNTELLSSLAGKRLSLGPEGSGARSLALTLLATNGIESGGSTTFLDLDAESASKALLDASVDAVFLMGDSASSAIMRKLLRAPEIHLMSFAQADAYTRRIRYLNKVILPKGSLDFGKNLPSTDVALVAPTVELIARAKLHPALSDLLLDAAREIHGNSSLLQRRGEFPAPLEHDIRISEEAIRFYKTGKTFLYRHLPFWFASVVNRILVVIVPAVVLLIPGVRLIPALFAWRIKFQLFRHYRALLGVERDLFSNSPPQAENLLKRLTEIEAAVNRMKIPASFADQFYSLRGHIGFVRTRLVESSKRPG